MNKKKDKDSRSQLKNKDCKKKKLLKRQKLVPQKWNFHLLSKGKKCIEIC